MVDNMEETPVMKTCTRCNLPKPATSEFFNKDRTKQDGLRTICAECRRSGSRGRVRKLPTRNDPQAKARMSALRRLVENHPSEFARLVRSEQERLGVAPPKTWKPVAFGNDQDHLQPYQRIS
jgi:hypothetical protein